MSAKAEHLGTQQSGPYSLTFYRVSEDLPAPDLMNKAMVPFFGGVTGPRNVVAVRTLTTTEWRLAYCEELDDGAWGLGTSKPVSGYLPPTRAIEIIEREVAACHGNWSA